MITRSDTAFACIPVLLLCLAAGSLQTQNGPNTFTSKSHGFSIVRPDETWSFKENRSATEGSLTLILQPDDALKGTVQASVRAKPLNEAAEPEDLRAQDLESIKGKPEYTDKKLKTFKAAGRNAPGIMVDMKAYGMVFRIHQLYLVEGGMQYILACHAPAKDFKSHASTFKRIFDSFEFTPVSGEMKAELKLLAMVGRCGSELAWARDWEEAAKRAGKEKKLVLVLVRSLSSFNISDQATTGPLMDPDVVDLVRERFVMFRFEKGMDAPFVSQEAYGLSPSTFGTSFLVVTPKGEVVGDSFSMEAVSMHEFLIAQLANHPELDGASYPKGRKGPNLIKWHLDRGDYDQAAKRLKAPSSPREHLLKADLLRRFRKGEEALAEIEAARTEGPGELEADLSLAEAVILIRMERYNEAQKVLERVLKEHRESDRVPEALYWSGACKLRLGGTDEAAAVWRELTAAHGESRWAWKAAAMLKSTAFSLGMGERLDWPSDEVLSLLEFHPFQRVKPSRVRQAEQDAIGYLLSQQRPNGSWISPAEVHRFSDDIPNEFTDAITAICGQGLLPHRDKAGVTETLHKAVDFLVKTGEKRKAAENKAYFMDYTVWRNAYVLWFFSDCIRAGLFEMEELEPAMAEFVPEIRDRQKPGGGWSYYVTAERSNAGQPSKQSNSFITAAAVVALLEAREAGVEVPEEMTDAALGCLERMANPDGTFEYFLFHDREDAPRNTHPAGAAGRAPLCAYALYKGGRGSLDALRKGLKLFMEYRHTYAKEHGKSLMHAGAHTQGSHYLMFDYAFAAATVRALPEKERGKYRKPLLEQILGARTEEGSYIDNPLIGRHYGTGMALVAFRHLYPLP